MKRAKGKLRFLTIATIAIVVMCGLLLSTLLTQWQSAKAADTPDWSLNEGNSAFKTDDGIDYTNSLTKANAFNAEAMEETIILLKNDNDTLPLKGDERKITLFGKNTYGVEMAYGGAGSSSTGGIAGQVYMENAFADAGFDINQETMAYYRTTSRSGSKRDKPGVNQAPGNWDSRETDPRNFDTAMKNSHAAGTGYDKVAIVTFTRCSGESFDLPMDMTIQGRTSGTNGRVPNNNGSTYTQWNSSSTDNPYWTARNAPGQNHYLMLDPNEKALLLYLKEQGFEKTIVMLNGGTQFEVPELMDPAYGVGAVLYIGYPGASGNLAVPKIFTGEVTPSAKTFSTWASDFLKMPSMQDYAGINRAGRSGEVTGYSNSYIYGTNQTNSNGNRYQEGLYVGYRYYETRAYEESLKVPTIDDPEWEDPDDGSTAPQIPDPDFEPLAWHDEQVLFPFGYGLSYTDFSWEIVGGTADDKTIAKDEELSYTVRVTNTGTAPGKDVVQLYFSAPYFKGGIEKSHVVLANYEKTRLLQPGQSDNVTIKIDAKEMASYDYRDDNGNGFTGYELEAGDYKIYLASDSFSAWSDRSTLCRTVKVADSDTTGDFAQAPAADKGANGFKYDKSVTGYTIQNRFDDCSDVGGWGWTWKASTAAQTGGSTAHSAGKFEPMSRADFEGTFPQSPQAYQRYYGSATPGNSAPNQFTPGADGVYAGGTAGATVNAAYDETAPWRVTEAPLGNNGLPSSSNPTTQQDIVLADLIGVDKDDSLWDDYLDQFSTAQLASLLVGFYTIGGNGAANSNYSATNGMPNFGVGLAWQPDGPTGFAAGSNTDNASSGIGNLGCYYLSPVNIAASFNKELAEEIGRMMGNEGLVLGMSGIYAPAVNIHRTPFGGRNFEYFSEDGVLSGRQAAEMVRGLQSKGIIPTVKHFAINDQETNRGGGCMWFTEQAAREIYLRAFQIPVEEGGSLAIMSSFNRVGSTSAMHHYGMLTEVLKNEWGLTGYVVTDWYGGGGNQSMTAGIRAGNDMCLGTNTGGTVANAGTNPDNNYDNTSTSTGYRNTHIAALRRSGKNILFALSRSNAVFRPNSSTSQAATYDAGTETFNVDVSSSRATFYNGSWLNPRNQSGQSTTPYGNAYRHKPSDWTVSYRLSAGETLPAGWTLNTSTGKLSGTVNEAFTVSVDTMVTTSGLTGTWRFATNEFGVNDEYINYSGKTFTGVVGQGFSGSVDFADADLDNNIKYTLVSGTLPSGVYLGSNYGSLTGTPTEAGTFTFTVKARLTGTIPGDYTGPTQATATFTIIIDEPAAAYDDSELRALITALSDKIDLLSNYDDTDLLDAIDDILEQLGALENYDDEELRDLINDLAEELAKLENFDDSALWDAIDEILDRLDGIDDDIADIKGDIASLTSDLADLESAIDDIDLSGFASASDLTTLSGALDILKGRVTDLEALIGDGGEIDLSVLQDKIEELEDKIDELATTPGDDGKSAYDLWIEEGNEGSVQDFLDSLKGVKGDKGETGDKGDPGDKGETGAQGPKGDTGAQGPKGDTGAQGPKGETGAQGLKGDTGAEGPAGDPGGCNSSIGIGVGAVMGVIMLSGAILVLKRKRTESK